MNFTDQIPTKPGDYRMRPRGSSGYDLVVIYKSTRSGNLLINGMPVSELTGGWEWCGPLVAPDEVVTKNEVKQAFTEGVVCGIDATRDEAAPSFREAPHATAVIDGCWHHSRARKVVEGEQ